MRGRFCALALCSCAVVLAEAPITVSDLVGRVTASLAVDRNDERIASSLEWVRLSERLSDTTIGLLKEMGAGTWTVHRLQSLGKRSRALPAPAEEPLSRTPLPSTSERTAMVNAMRRYAAGYVANLPDFTCTREARRFRSRAIFWLDAGSYTAEVSYVGGIDHDKLTLLNNRPTKRSFDEFRDRFSWGEFSGILKNVFVSAPDFAWDRWEVTEGNRAAVFTCHVDRTHSGYGICCPRATAAYRGSLYTNPKNGAVLRIIVEATGLGNDSPILASAYVLDFGEVTIAGNRYLLPRRSIAYGASRAAETREDIYYLNYRKFDADTTIVFPDEGGKGDKPR